jgi:hypothetical protein
LRFCFRFRFRFLFKSHVGLGVVPLRLGVNSHGRRFFGFFRLVLGPRFAFFTFHWRLVGLGLAFGLVGLDLAFGLVVGGVVGVVVGVVVVGVLRDMVVVVLGGMVLFGFFDLAFLLCFYLQNFTVSSSRKNTETPHNNIHPCPRLACRPPPCLPG